LLEAIGGCVAEIDKATYNTEVLAKAEEQIQRYLPMMRQSLLQSVLSGDSTTAFLADDFKRLRITLDPESPVMLLAARLSVGAKTEIVTSINVVIREKIGHAVDSEIGWVGSNTILWLIQPRGAANFTRAQAAVKGMAENVQRLCMNVLKVKVSFVLNPNAVPWQGLGGPFSQLKFVITHRLEQQSDIALAELDFFLGKPPGEKTQDDRFVIRYKDLLKKLSLCMSLDDLEGMHKITDALSRFSFTGGEAQEAGLDILELNTSLNLILLSYITQKGLQEQLKEDYSIRLFLSDTGTKNCTQRIQQFSQIADLLLLANKQEQRQSGDMITNRLLSYIHENLGADLSLFALSEKVFLNPSYLSRRFKEITGKNITDTVAEIRIDEACRLLREGSYRVNQIAAMVGYDSAAYFSKIFKRKTGSTPQEYQDRAHQKQVVL
jgi:two-component system response regulator YesN